MARSKKSKSASSEPLKEAWAVMNANPFLAPQLEHFWDAQDYVRGESQAFVASWFERHQAAAQRAMDVARTLAAEGPVGPVASLKAMSEWQSGSAARLEEDIREWLALCSRCADYVARSETEATEEGIEKAVKTIAPMQTEQDDVPV